MSRTLLIVLLLLVGCTSQTKEELVAEGDLLIEQENYRGAIVLYRNALEKDANYLDARVGLAEAYLQSGSYERAENELQKVLLQSPDRHELRLKLATVYIQRQQPEQALVEIGAFHDAMDETAQSLVLYGLAHGASGDLDAAEEFFNQALRLDPASADARLNLAKVALYRRQIDRAAVLLREAINIDARLYEAYYLLARIETSKENITGAIKVYQDLLAIDQRQLEALYTSGLLQLDLGDFEAVATTVNQLKTRFSDQSEGPRLEGMLAYRNGDYQKARTALQTSQNMQPHLLGSYFLGLTHYSLDELEMALSQFQRALDINPDFEQARVMVAMVLLKQRRLDDVVIETERLLRRSPGNAYAHNILGSALIARGDFDRGMEALATATQLDPSLVDAHLKRGLMNFARGEQSLGEADLVRAIEAAPEVLNNRLLLVTHYLRQRNFTAAIDLLQQGMNGEATDALLHNYLAAAYFSQNRPEQALTELTRAKEVHPEYLTPYYNTAAYYVSASRHDEAIAEYRQVLAVDPRQIRALLGLATIYSMRGEQEHVNSVMDDIIATNTEQGYMTAAQYALRQQRFDEATALVDRGLALASDSAPLLEMKGGLLARAGESVLAEEHYRRLAEVSPERGYQLLTQLYLSTEREADARQLVDGLIAETPAQVYPWLLAAALDLQKENVPAAKEQLRRGISQVESPAGLQLRLGQLEEATNNTAEAEELYRQVLEVAPRLADAHFSMGTLKDRTGDKKAALESYRNTVAVDERHVGALNNLAYLLVTNFGEARQALDPALSAYRLRPGDPRIMDTLGFVLMENDRLEEADKLLTEAHRLLPEVPAVSLHLAMARSRLGTTDGIRELLQPVLDRGSADEAAQARRLLESL